MMVVVVSRQCFSLSEPTRVCMGCRPQISLTAHFRRPRLKAVFAVQAAEHRFGDDTVAVVDLMASFRRDEGVVHRLRNGGPQTGMGTAAIVVTHLFGKEASHVSFAPWNQEIQTLTSDRPD